jgi:hypothetical protein
VASFSPHRSAHRCDFGPNATRLGRCNRRVERSELTELLVAKFAPSGLATPPTDPIVFGNLVAPDAGTETGSDTSGKGGLRPLPTEVPTEVVRNREIKTTERLGGLLRTYRRAA